MHQGGARADVPRSVLAWFVWSRSLGLGWPGLRSGWGDCGGLAGFSALL